MTRLRCDSLVLYYDSLRLCSVYWNLLENGYWSAKFFSTPSSLPEYRWAAHGSEMYHLKANYWTTIISAFPMNIFWIRPEWLNVMYQLSILKLIIEVLRTKLIMSRFLLWVLIVYELWYTLKSSSHTSRNRIKSIFDQGCGGKIRA